MFYTKLFFSLARTYDIPILQITQEIIFFYLDNCYIYDE